MAMQPMQPMYQQPPPKQGFPAWAIILIAFAGVGVLVFVVMIFLGIYGTRRYVAAAKTAEAKNSIGAISRGAVAAYERDGKLCGAATPVPATVLAVAGKKYMPSSLPGSDFQTGSATAGWKCLKFDMTFPQYYQYHYNQGGRWVAPTVAPGPDGFEAAAKGDLDGDGKTSTFARTGVVMAATRSVSVATSIYVEDEFE